MTNNRAQTMRRFPPPASGLLAKAKDFWQRRRSLAIAGIAGGMVVFCILPLCCTGGIITYWTFSAGNSKSNLATAKKQENSTPPAGATEKENGPTSKDKSPNPKAANKKPTPAVSPWAAEDQHALKATAKNEESLTSLSSYLGGPFKTERQKVRAVFRWVTDRIVYDVAILQDLDKGLIIDDKAETVLRTRKAICGGYAKIFAALCEGTGVKVVLVDGIARFQDDPSDQKLDHAWNAVKLDDKWWLVDPTLGAGYLNQNQKHVKHLTELFFLTPPEILALTHFPDEVEWLGTSEPLTKDQFKKQPPVSVKLLEMGVRASAIRAYGKEEKIQFIRPASIAGFTAQVKIEDLPLSHKLQAGKDYNFSLKCSEPVVEVFIINGGARQLFRQEGEVFSYKAKAQNGKLKVCVKQRNEPDKYGVLLEYDVGDCGQRHQTHMGDRPAALCQGTPTATRSGSRPRNSTVPPVGRSKRQADLGKPSGGVVAPIRGSPS